MAVATMAILSATIYFGGGIAVIVALLSSRWPWLVFVNAGILLWMLALQVVAIPISLNWSRRLYGGLLRRLLGFVLFTVLIYGLHYYFAGVQVSPEGVSGFTAAMLLSFSTWTTLGVDTINLNPALAFALPLESLTALLTAPVLIALIWLYCEERLTNAADTPMPADVPPLRFDRDFGVLREADSPESRHGREIRAKRIQSASCTACGGRPAIERFWDISGGLTPLPKFVAICDCGRHSDLSANAYLAAVRWRRMNPLAKTDLATGHPEENGS